ncbi:MAG TPA: SIMPL domain-containing protein [Anaerolineae bacterium]|nr:SIMPL domain-containing protein [Anaerolineae bacterium]
MLARKIFYGLVVLVVVAALSIGGLAFALAGGSRNAQPVAEAAGQTAAERSITVVGVGKATGQPTIARVTVGIETQAPSLQKAVDDNKAKMNGLLDTLKKLGLADKDIRTSNYSVYTERIGQPEIAPEKPVSTDQMIYHVTNQVDVTVRDVNQLGDVLDKAVAAGANNIYGVNFSVEDTTKLEADARTKAVADAKARAESLAQLNGVQLGEVVSVSEVVGGAPVPLYRDAAAGMGGGGTAVQPGELEISTSIQITYAVK